jgi:hypothetical protein
MQFRIIPLLPSADSGFNYVRWELILLSKKTKGDGNLKNHVIAQKHMLLELNKYILFLRT